jgi:hypothetical protein
MERTPEQKTADDALSEAINAVVEAYGYRQPDMANINYLVLIEQAGWDGDGDRRTGIVSLYKDGDLPWTTILGLMRAATLLAERNYTRDGDDGP